MNPFERMQLQQTRRAFLGRAATGVGSIALASLMSPIAALAAGRPTSKPQAGKWRGILNPPHFAPKAKRVIFLCMAGGPSHLETLDYKPKLAELHGQPMPESFTKGQQIAQLQGAKKLTCMAPQYPFVRCGRSGQEISKLFRYIPEIADDICIIRSLKTEA